MRATAEVSQPKNSDAVIFEPGTYNTKVVEIFLVAGTKYQSDEPQIEAIFQWEVDAETRPVRDGFNKVGFVQGTAKLELQTDRKYVSKFQGRLEALVGQQLAAEDAARLDVDIDAPSFVENFDDLLNYLQESDDQGRPRRAAVKSFKVGERELIGADALITLSVTEKTKNGQKVEYQKIDAVTAIPKRTAGPRRAGQAAPAQEATAAPVAAPAQQPEEPEQAVLMDPPPNQRRRATTEPDLPF